MAEWHPALVSWDLLRHLVGSTLEKVINHKKVFLGKYRIFENKEVYIVDNFVQGCL